MQTVLIYMTAGTMAEAERIGAALVEARLAACVNLIPGMQSLYWWDGGVQKDEEVILVAKTRESLAEAVQEKVKALHSYECPCIVVLPMHGGNPEFLDWIIAETAEAQKP